MAFCPNCGTQVDASMRFCPSCGNALAEVPVSAVVQTPVVTAPVVTAPVAGDYRVVLISVGSCTLTTARELLRDILGYTAAEARRLTDNTPIEIATALTLQQAVSIAQLFSEYGMQIAVCNSTGYVNVDAHIAGNAVGAGGTLAAGIAAALATLTVGNRVRDFLRWNAAVPGSYLFAPRYRYSVPPPLRRPAPPRPKAPPRPAPPPPPPPRPAPPKAAARPAPPKPSPGPRGNGGGGAPRGGPSGGNRGGGFGGKR